MTMMNEKKRRRKKMTSHYVRIFCDGACRGNPGPGGWSAIVSYQKKERVLYGSHLSTTNNRMELTAAIEALSILKKSCLVVVITDSEYLCRGITKWLPKWKQKGWITAHKRPVKNQPLWVKLDQLNQYHQIQWEWVKAHVAVKDRGIYEQGNERADQLANFAIDELLKEKYY